MKIVILEGIATSGKSTVISKLKAELANINVLVADESETHIPIMDRRAELHAAFFEQLINRFASKKPDLIIFDRLYLTQAFRAGVSLAEYQNLEDHLAVYDTLTVFLRVDEADIQERLSRAAEHLEKAWGDYLKTRGNGIEEAADYYINQQKSQLALLKTSKLPYLVYDTTSQDYDKIVAKILERLSL